METRLNKQLTAVNCERLPMWELKELSQHRCEQIAELLGQQGWRLALYETPQHGVFGVSQADASPWVN